MDIQLASIRQTDAASLLTKILTVDGVASGLDADLLDGQQGSYYLDLANGTGTLAVARLPALSGGDVTSAAGSGTLTIGNGAVTLPKMANLAPNSIIGNNTGSAATPVELTGAQVKSMLSLAKADVGLGSVDNTSDAGKPVSTAQQTALNLKANLSGDTFIGVVKFQRNGVTGQYLNVDFQASNMLGSYSDPTNAKDLYIDSTTNATNDAPTAGSVGINLRVLGGIRQRVHSAGVNTTGYHNVSSLVRSTGYLGFDTTGVGVELFWHTGQLVGNLLAYDRDNSAYKPLYLEGSAVNLRSSGVNIAVISSTGVAVTGTLTVSGDITSNGIAFYGDGKSCLKFSDSWLRLNDGGDFTSGIYFGTGIARTDGELQVGTSGTYFKANTTGVFVGGEKVGPEYSRWTTLAGNVTLTAAHANTTFYNNTTTNRTLTNSATDLPEGTMFQCMCYSTGTIILSGGTNRIFWFKGDGATPVAGNRTISRGGWASVVVNSNGQWFITGIGIS